MSFQTRTVYDKSSESSAAVPTSGSFSSLLTQVQSARVRAEQMGLKASEIALRRAVIAMSNELGVPSGLDPHELLFIE